MASLEHRNENGRDCYRLRFTLDGKRHHVSLADFDDHQAADAKEHVEHLIAQTKRNKPPNESTSEWLDTLPAKIHDRLAVLKLIEPRRRVEAPRKIIAFMRAYIAERTDWKKPENYNQAVDHLKKWLRGDAPINALTRGDVERWKRWMTTDKKGPGLSENTAGQNIKRCRQMMRQAVDDGLIEANPFAGIKIDLSSDSSRNRYVTRVDADAILEACPDQEWRVIFALCRIAGLRGPSEITPLKWSDISWERGRFTVTSPKTKRYGKATRVVPLFDEVRQELADLLEINGGASKYVISRYRDSTTSLSTRFNSICVRAGVEEIPKPFPNLRASARRDLKQFCVARDIDPAAVTAWLGHDATTAEKYYDRVTDEDYDRAVGTLVGTSGAAGSFSQLARDAAKAGNDEEKGNRGTHGRTREYTPEDSNL